VRAGKSSGADAGPTGLFSSTFLPLLFVIGLIVALAAVARGIIKNKGGLVGAMGAGGRAPSGVLEVLGRYPVARGSTLVLLKLDRRVLLLAQSRGGKLGGAGSRPPSTS
jgi:flagellar biogenesis protein FliO